MVIIYINILLLMGVIMISLLPVAFFVGYRNRSIQALYVITTTITHIFTACLGMSFAISFYKINLMTQYVIVMAIVFIVFFFRNKGKILNEDDMGHVKSHYIIVDMKEADLEKLEEAIRWHIHADNIRYNRKASNCIIFVMYLLITWFFLSYGI